MIEQVISILEGEFPDATIALNFEGEFQLLVAVILSAQCTDERVNKVTPALFARFPRVEDFAQCDIEELEKLIYSTGFYRAKAKNIRAAAVMIVEEFGGAVPSEMESLLRLPGVARKTANVVMWTAFGRAEGIVVDTHVIRISGLLGLVSAKLSAVKNAVKIEKELCEIVPHNKWGGFAHLLILHGRKTCIARRPRCGECVLNKICPSAKPVPVVAGQ
ncbi:endonuclease III [Candidatus Gracilibacteria bacterium]|nr:endonuclease III [Candidatus Gracilibacteria bacterium]